MKNSIRITNNGNTIRATGDFANQLFKAMTKAAVNEESNNVKVACRECGKVVNDDLRCDCNKPE